MAQKVKYRSEIPIKKKFKFSLAIQLIGILAFIFSLFNYFYLSKFTNWIILYALLVFLAGTFMGLELYHVKEKETPNSIN